MILSSIIGLALWWDKNPFLLVDRKQKITTFLQIAFVIAILSFLSSFMRVSEPDLFSSLILLLIIVICPLGLVLFWKREKNSIDFIILVSSTIIILFILQFVGYSLMGPFAYREAQLTIFPPLSYPLMVSQKESFIGPPPTPYNNHFYYDSVYNIGLILPLLSIPLSHDFLQISSDVEGYESIWENVRLQNQFFIFILFFVINYFITLITMKIWAKQENKHDINQILNRTCRATVLVVNVSFVSVNVPGFVAFLGYRLIGDIAIEAFSFLFLLMGVPLSMVIISLFYKYPFLQENYEHMTTRLLLIAVAGAILLILELLIELVSPLASRDIHVDSLTLFQSGIVAIGIILMTLLLMYRPVLIDDQDISKLID